MTGLTPGSIANYTCENAYHLRGDVTRTCDSSGLWTDNEPTCVRKYLMITHIPSDCALSYCGKCKHPFACVDTCMDHQQPPIVTDALHVYFFKQ